MNRDRNFTPGRARPLAAPLSQPEADWLPAARAAELLGLGRSSIHRLADEGFLEDCFFSPHKRRFSRESVLVAQKKRFEDREFWRLPTRAKRALPRGPVSRTKK